MDIQTVSQLIATLGFPIIACGALFWYINKQADQHAEEMNSMRSTIEENTSVLQSLKELIQVIINKNE